MGHQTRRQARDRLIRLAEANTDVLDLLRETVAVLRAALPVEGWCGLVLDPATAVKTGSVHHAGLSGELFRHALDLEYRHQDVNNFAELARASHPAAVLAQSCDGQPQRSARYREVLTPAGYEHELRLVLRDRGAPWGGFVFLRERGSAPFTQADSDLLASVSGPLAQSIRRASLRSHVDGVSHLRKHPGLLILDADQHVESITPGTEHLLAGILDEPSSTYPLPAALQAVAAQTLGSADAAPTQARIPTRYGGWITVYGLRLEPSPRIALSIEHARPETAATLALDSYGLSPRERQVADLILTGHSTHEIAHRLFLSPHTVRDHLKAIFVKTGTHSRRELITDLFLRHYQPGGEHQATS
ncbi:LuxR C-terminal-related transcriptional regulator [Actinomycetes bacterium KLBMP 9797]